MKPILVEFQAFGPYEGKETVNFEKLAENGLFLIDGKTGSGKTMILDAITFALYGQSSGSTRDDLKQLRCSHCNPKDDTYVKFIFEEKGVRYIFERRLRMATKKLHDEFSCLKVNKEGIKEPLLENCKGKEMTAKAAELIGLSFDQFRQVIILPQGKFEKLLTSDSKDKEEILVNIFDAGKWQKIAQKYFEKAKAKNDELQAIKVKVDNSLAEEGCISLEELEYKATALDKEIKEEENEFKKADYVVKKRELNEKKALASEFNMLESYDDALKDLKDEESYVKDDEETLKLAEEAETLRKPLEDLETAKNKFDGRIKEQSDAKKELEKANNDLTKAKDALAEHQKSKPFYEANLAAKTELDLKKDIYTSLEKLVEKLEDSEQLKEYLLDEVAALEGSSKDAVEALKIATEALDKATENEANVRKSYLNGITGHIAKDLSEGTPCPVCGSIHHPSLATVPEGSATAKDVENAEAETKRKNTAWKKADKERAAAEKALAGKKDESAKAVSEYEKAKKDVENAKKSLVKGIESLDDFNSESERLKKEIGKYEKADKTLAEKLEKATKEAAASEKGFKTAEIESEKAEDAVKAAESALKEALLKTRFESEEDASDSILDLDERNDLRESINTHYAKVKEYNNLRDNLATKLSEKTKPDSKVIDDELDAIDKVEAEYNTMHGKKLEQHKHLSKKYKDLTKEYAVYEKEHASAESNLTFARLLRGDTGVGLQRYVLGIMFSSVIRAANEMLKNVAEGRYQLFRTSEKTGDAKQRGLDLMVRDSCGGAAGERSVSTMSGGEKFLASLALSIGLAGIAKGGGVDIEGIFIDEGFGTLDEDCIADALDILKSVQKANGLVGIISHVELLRSTIYPQVQVKVDDRKSSHIEIS